MLRIWSLKLIGKILQLASGKKKEKLISNNKLLLIKKNLEQYSFNETTYFALLEILVESVNNREFKNPLQHEEQEFFIKNPIILAAIFELVCTTGETSLQYKILQDFGYLLNQSGENRNAFLRQPYWQNWLLGLLANNSGQPSNSASEVFKQVVKLFTLLFHHCLSDNNGFKVFSDSQGLLNYFGGMGFFNCVEITRDINNSMLRTVAYDARILQQSQKSSIVWENLTKWLSFTEECLFITPQSIENNENQFPIDEHFILGIHRRYDGMWIDFEFAQKLLDFLDSLLLSPHLTEESRPSIPNAEENLIRLALRLTLYTLYETDAFLNTDKIQERSKNLKNVEIAVDEYFSDQILYPHVKEGLSNYLQGKIKQWNSEMNSVDKVFQKNIDRLRQIVNRLLKMDNEINRLLYIISFLYRAMKRSYEHQGIGAELILNIFKEILISCIPILPLTPELKSLSEDQLVEFFMRHFAYPQENPQLFKQLDDGIKQVLLEEQLYSNTIYENLQKNTTNICSMVKIYHHKETEYIDSQLLPEYAQIIQNHQKIEHERIDQEQRFNSQIKRSLTKKTKSILKELSHERGPWATPEIINQKKHWKLSKIEVGDSRKRMILDRNRNFNSHDKCAKGGEFIKDENIEKNTIELLSHINTNNLSSNNNNDDKKIKKSLSESLSSSSINSDEGDIPTITNNETKIIFQCSCDLITPMNVTPGSFELTPVSIYFIVNKESIQSNNNTNNNDKNQNNNNFDKKQTSQKWAVKNIKFLHARRYLLRNNGLELFLTDHTTHFLNFSTSRIRDNVWRKILSLHPPLLVDFGSGGSITNLAGFGTPPSGSQLLKRMNITSQWRNREISNFEYLMQLNTLAGRTYNDLTQYPIFPWILKDYTSSILDLSNPNIYRDLSKPIGALNQERLDQFIARYEAFDDPVIPKFHYGSHYSNVGIVLYYLLRMEPFTSYFLTLQDGKFDHITRMFMSIIDTWDNVLTNPSDVKELIPEFFYLPEFLENQNNFCFGYYQENEVRCNVELPLWAKDTHDFITKHREALESDYVSEHLNEWIDLIFGYKQRGPDAETSHNLFFYLTYEGVIDIDSIEDPIERSSIESQIINFGQTPSQLFEKPHPKRKSIEQIQKGKQITSLKNVISPFYDIDLKITKPIIYVKFSYPDKLLCLSMDGILTVNLFNPKFEKNSPFIFELDKSINTKNQRRIDMIYPEPIACPSGCFNISKDCKILFSCGMWNDDIQARTISSQCTKIASAEHRDIVTCLTLTKDGLYLISGSKDCTVVIWNINTSSSLTSNSTLNLSSFWSSSKNKSQVFKVKQILYGHTDTITCVQVSQELDLVLSGSKDKTVNLYHFQSGKFLRSLKFNEPIGQIYLSSEGNFIVYGEETKTLSLYTINGHLLQKRKTILTRILNCTFSNDGKYFITAGVGNALIVRNIPSFNIVYLYEVPCSVFSIDFINGNDLSFLVVGLMNGKIRIIPFDTSNFLINQPKEEIDPFAQAM